MHYLFVILIGAINSGAVALAALPEFDLLLNWNVAPSIPIAPESAEAPSRACCIIGLEQIYLICEKKCSQTSDPLRP